MIDKKIIFSTLCGTSFVIRKIIIINIIIILNKLPSCTETTASMG